MSGRGLAHAVDADMAGFDQRSSAGAGLHQTRMPQPFVETLAIHERSSAGPLGYFLTRFLPQLSLRNLRKLDCYANRAHPSPRRLRRATSSLGRRSFSEGGFA